MGLFKKIVSISTGAVIGALIGGPVGALVGAAAFASGVPQDLLGKLLLPKIPGAPENLEENGQDYKASVRNKPAELGDVKPEVLGQTRVAFKLKNLYYGCQGSEQYIFVWAHVTRGYAQLSDLNINMIPLANFGQQLSALLWPGVPLPTWIHPNVYTSGDVGDQELVAGSLTHYLTASESVTVTTGTAPSSSRIARSGFFDGAYIDMALSIKTSAIAGEYIVVDADPAADWVEVQPTVTNGTYSAVFEWTGYSDNGDALTVPKKDADDIELVFSAGPDQISGPAGSMLPINVNDELIVLDSPLNEGKHFTVRWSDGDSTIGVSPAPTPETVTGAKLRLVIRRGTPVYDAPRGEKTLKAIASIFYGSGLGFAEDSDTISNRTIQFEFRWQEVDDAGNPLGDWTTEYFEQTDNVVRRPRRIDQVFAYSTAARRRVTLARLTGEPNDTRRVDACTWGQFRAELEPRAGEDQTVDPDCTTVALRVRVTGSLTAQQQQRFNGRASRLAAVYADGVWGDRVPTRNFAWQLAQWLVENSRGVITRDMLNVDAGDPRSFVSRAAAADAEEIAGFYFCDANIDAEVRFWEMAQAIAGRFRCELFRDPITGLFSLARDEESTPVEVFAHGLNCQLGDLKMETPTLQTRFGVRANFTDGTTWQPRDDGPVYGDDEDPREITVFGCTSWDAAYPAAYFDYADARYRVIDSTLNTEREGRALKLKDRVWVGGRAYGLGDAANVYSLTGTALMVLPPVKWQPGAQHYVILQSADGNHTARINVTRGASDQLMTLASDPGITLRTDGVENVCLFGWDAAEGVRARGPKLAICQGGTADGLRRMNIDIAFDDSRVYADPGEPPIDPMATTGVAPVLTATITSLTMVSGHPVVTVSASSGTIDIDYEWCWQGDLSFTRFNYGAITSAIVPAVGGGVLQVRVKPYGDAVFGDYSEVAELVIGGAGSLTVTLSRYDAYGAKNGAIVTTGQTVSPTVSGGTGPYTGVWVRDPIDDFMNALNPTGATKFQGNVGISGSGQDNMFYRATDSLGAVADSPPVLVTLESLGGSTL